CLLILLIPSNKPLILSAVSFISSFKSPLILPSSLERWLNVSATASPRSATTDRAPLSSGSFERSLSDSQKLSIVACKPSLDCSFIKLSILDNAFCRVDQYPILLFSVRYCVSRNLFRILSITPISTPVPFCPAPPGIILAAFGKEG